MAHLFEVLRRPLETEKSRYQNTKLHKYVFEVSGDATKAQIKDAVKELFDVDAIAVNIVVLPAKRGRRGRTRRELVRKAQYKKAIITIPADQTISEFEGVQ
jgi:large subunit ribosomal protein L23